MRDSISNEADSIVFDEFKTNFLNPKWKVYTTGLFFDGKFYTWDKVKNLKKYASHIYSVSINDRNCDLYFSDKDEERATQALAYIQQKISENSIGDSEADFERAESFEASDQRPESLQIYQEKNIDELMQIAEATIPSSECLYVALKGVFKEYLFCTDKTVYIVKKGFMTGHTFGGGVFKMPYINITNAEVDYHFATGYFELSSGGLQNKPLNYWDNKDNSPQKAPNAISISGGELKSDFERATHFILEMIAKAKNPQVTVQQTSRSEKSFADQIRELKALLDEGLITQEEFDSKKKQILGL